MGFAFAVAGVVLAAAAAAVAIDSARSAGRELARVTAVRDES